MSHACRCGRPKGRASDLACLGRWERLTPKLRAEYGARAKSPASPSYGSTLSRVVSALAEVRKP